jgi:hypothetical protein
MRWLAHAPAGHYAKANAVASLRAGGLLYELG